MGSELSVFIVVRLLTISLHCHLICNFTPAIFEFSWLLVLVLVYLGVFFERVDFSPQRTPVLLKLIYLDTTTIQFALVAFNWQPSI